MIASKDQTLLQRLEAVKQKHQSLESMLSDPRVLSSGERLKQVAKERAELGAIVDAYARYRQLLDNIRFSEEILQDQRSDPEFKLLATGELKELRERRQQLEDELWRMLLPKDLRDDKNTFLEIRAGTGGEEAALFASQLARMYARYAERRGWRVEMVSSNPTGIGGLKEAILLVEGKGAYNRLKHESGVHRVQRVPKTEASGRIHTSAVTVAVLPEADEVEVTIDPKDLRVDTFCASGPGGQGVNTTHSAVRITHVPTKIVVSCQDERSQLKNKAKAMRILRSRLMELERERQESEIARTRKAQVGTGDRSEKIRTYNFPQNRVTDHRVGLTLHRLEQILEGDLDEFIEALITSEQTEKLGSTALSP